MTNKIVYLFILALTACNNNPNPAIKDKMTVPQMTNDEIKVLLEALQISTMPQELTVNTLFFYDSTNTTLMVCLRIDQSQYDNIVQNSWLKSHRVIKSSFAEYVFNLSEIYKIKWWNPLPLDPKDDLFHIKLNESGGGSISAIGKIVGTDIYLYLSRGSLSQYFNPNIFTIMRKGKPPPMHNSTFPGRVQAYEIKGVINKSTSKPATNSAS